MADGPLAAEDDFASAVVAGGGSAEGLGGLLRFLRRRHARRLGIPEPTYRELAAATGWARSAIGHYFTGRVLPPTDRFDDLIRLLGAAPAELARLAAARDRVEELRRTTVVTPAGSVAPLPRQLPHELTGFVGRQEELAILDSLVPTATRPAAASVATISGPAGLGKTALAVRWGQQSIAGFPDGQLYLDLRGFGPGCRPLTPETALRFLLDSLGVASPAIPHDLEALADLYRAVMSGRQMLVLLDNVGTEAQVRPLLPGSTDAVVLITSRRSLRDLVDQDGARAVPLKSLSMDEARELLGERIGADRLARESAAADRVIVACTRLPLALAMVAARAAADPALRMDSLARELTAGSVPAAPQSDDGGTEVDHVLRWSYRLLSTGAARLFRLLSVHPGPAVSEAAAASLAAIPTSDAAQALAELAEVDLLAPDGPDRYQVHDLLRQYSGWLSGQIDAEADIRSARHRLYGHYVLTVRAAIAQLDPAPYPIPVADDVPGAVACLLADRSAAAAWLTAEHRSLLRVLTAPRHSDLIDRMTWRLAAPLAELVDRHAESRADLDTLRAVVAAADRTGELAAQAAGRLGLGRELARRHQLTEARHHLELALGACQQLGDRAGTARAWRNLSLVAEGLGEHEEARRLATSAMAVFRTLGERAGLARALRGISGIHRELGEHTQAAGRAEEALSLVRHAQDPTTEARTWNELGAAYHRLADHRRAVGAHMQALALHRALGDRHGEAMTLDALGDAHHAAGNRGEARRCWSLTVTFLDTAGFPDETGARRKLARARAGSTVVTPARARGGPTAVAPAGPAG